MAIGRIRAALGAALVVAGAGLGVVGAMASRAADEGALPLPMALDERLAAPASEVTVLAEALERHLPSDATVLAWPDVARQLGVPEDTPTRFDWTAALLAPRDEGIRLLRERAGDRPVHLVIHVRDALLLGAAAPERIGVALRDKADSGNLHGMINSARDWVRTEGLVAYTAYRLDEGRLRLVGLTDEASLNTLVARLLPFHDPRRRIEPVPGLTLVHQVGGFWVYRLEPDQG